MLTPPNILQSGTDSSGLEMYQLIRELYPICRSITGNGVRQSLSILKKHIPLEIHEVPSGSVVFDWTVPREWNITDAYIKNGRGQRVVDFRENNLHVVNYSIPIRETMPLARLRTHLFTLPDQPDWIPYRTSYYKDIWGFCLSQKQLDDLPDGDYEVCIESSLQDGYLTYGEYYIPGETKDEILISCHACHPSLCNDNLSGVALATYLAKSLVANRLRYSYRFLFIPGTIGSITWLSRNESRVHLIKHGLVLACVGDPGGFTYKRSRRGDATIDNAAGHVLKHLGSTYRLNDFSPFGYDERQFCSPGFDLPVGCFMRTPHGQYPEYHTSADNLNFVNARALSKSFSAVHAILQVLEHNRTYVSTNPKCEPHLGKRGLYRSVAGQAEGRTQELAMLWILNLSDGQHSLLEIAERAHLPFESILVAANTLHNHSLLREAPDLRG
jgi:aminopeptidase-like protein